MIESILQSVLGKNTEQKQEQGSGIGTLLVIGIILFVLLGGTKLLRKPEDAEDAAGC